MRSHDIATTRARAGADRARPAADIDQPDGRPIAAASKMAICTSEDKIVIEQTGTTLRAAWSMRSQEGLIPWLRRVIAGNLPVEAEVARLRQELEWANARADRAERDSERACDAAWREGEAAGYEAGYHRD